MKLDVHPYISPKPSPRTFQSSHNKPKLENKKEFENKVNEDMSISNGHLLETNGHSNGASDTKEDEVDEGLAALRRQPSIKDRRKVILKFDRLIKFVGALYL